MPAVGIGSQLRRRAAQWAARIALASVTVAVLLLLACDGWAAARRYVEAE